jgi:large subunit ribosomal protein L18
MRKKISKFANSSDQRRYRRHLSIRKKIIGSAERPRLCAIRSNKHIVLQVIDDSSSKTLLSLQTYGKNAVADSSNSIKGVKSLGAELAKKLSEKGLSKVVFDRNGSPYHGVLKALVESVRESGISV